MYTLKKEQYIFLISIMFGNASNSTPYYTHVSWCVV